VRSNLRVNTDAYERPLPSVAPSRVRRSPLRQNSQHGLSRAFAFRTSDALRVAAAVGASVWCGAQAISDADFSAPKGVVLTRLNYSPGTSDSESVERALDTIEQHHPGEKLWIEGVT
jgi:hypothetical protein